jgi:hypothetical protein
VNFTRRLTRVIPSGLTPSAAISARMLLACSQFWKKSSEVVGAHLMPALYRSTHLRSWKNYKNLAELYKNLAEFYKNGEKISKIWPNFTIFAKFFLQKCAKKITRGRNRNSIQSRVQSMRIRKLQA